MSIPPETVTMKCNYCNGEGWKDEGDPEIGSAPMTCDFCNGTGKSSMKTYVTFGQDHVHNIGGKILDKDCVAVVNGDRETVFELFGSKFCFEYSEGSWDDSIMKCFPRGYIEV